MTQPIPITVVIPVKNEAANLRECLSRLSGFTEVVVVDSQSIDETVAIAAAAGAKVLQFHWDGRFPKKRNWILKTYKFSTNWVLFLDADELIDETFKIEVAAAVEQPSIVGYWLNYRNHFMGRVLKFGVAQKKLALFRVGAGYYQQVDELNWTGLDMEVHEHPVLDGIVSELKTPIDHRDYRSLHHFIAKHNDYSTWEAQRWCAMRADGSRAKERMTDRQRIKYRYISYWWYAGAYFFFSYIWKQGFRDGGAGLHYALHKYLYFVQVRLKINELTSTPQPKNQVVRG